jgi:hypothetical protein
MVSPDFEPPASPRGSSRISFPISEDRQRDIELHLKKCPVDAKVKKYESLATGFVAAFPLIGASLGAMAVFVGKYPWGGITGHRP